MMISHTQKLISLRQERLHILEERQAQFGFNTPPEVVMEIRQLRKEIDELRAQLQREVVRDLTLADAQPECYSGLMLLIGPGRIDQDPLNQSALDAIRYHSPRLRHCWLIGSGGDGGSLPIANEIGQICERQGVVPHIWQVTDAFSIQESYDLILRLYAYEIPKSGLREQHVIADITGATKPMSIGMLLACGDHRPIQYMTRSTKSRSLPLLLRYLVRSDAPGAQSDDL